MAIPQDCIPEYGIRIFEITSKPDKENKQDFTVYWWGYSAHHDKEIVKAQCFHAVVLLHLACGDKLIDRTK